MPGQPLKDLTGQRFGDLTVIERAENRNGATRWRVICDCGTEKVVWATMLLQGRQKSCGHRKLERREQGFNGRKTCTKCGESKPLEAFSLKGKGDRRRGDCNACRVQPALSQFERAYQVPRLAQLLVSKPWTRALREALS